MRSAAPSIELTVEPSAEVLEQDALEVIAAMLLDLDEVTDHQPH